MIIEYLKYMSQNEIIKKLKKITMLKDDKNFVYEDAYISLLEVDPKILFPCQYYILKKVLDEKIALREAFLEHTISKFIALDILSLSSGFEFKLSNEPCCRTIIPPIIEESIEADGGLYPLINDGMHRIYLAMLLKSKISIIYIRGSKEPYYAYPLPNKWHDVKVVSEIDNKLIKKIHRIQNNKQLYRNFDSVFCRCSSPRGH